MRITGPRRAALALAVPVALVAGGVFASGQIERHAALLGAARASASEQLLTSMLDQETGARGFFQTRDVVFLEPWSKGTKSFAASLTRLRSLVAGDAPLTRSLDGQARRALQWHSATAAAIAVVRRGGVTQTVTAAKHAKQVMDAFRSGHAALDAQLTQRSRASLARASEISVALAVVLAGLLVWLALTLTRRSARRAELRRRDQAELRDLLQVAESEEESRRLLIRHLEKIVPGALAAVLSRNNSDDRLDATLSESGAEVPEGSPLSPENAARLHPRSCMAVRLSRSYHHHRGDDLLLRCDICGAMREASACEPLLVGGQVIGSVLVVSDKPIDESASARIRESVVQATPILDNQRNLMLAEARAASDALTGLPNRRAANETLKRMVAHAGRSVSELAAILLDLDHFKVINDRYGHESGDKALALVGRIIATTIRTSDFAARFGGEEFLILLPDTHREGALIVAEKIRVEIEHSEVPGVGPVTASLGVAVLPADAVEADELIRKADRALYTAKEGGRNRVHGAASRGGGKQQPTSEKSPPAE